LRESERVPRDFHRCLAGVVAEHDFDLGFHPSLASVRNSALKFESAVEDERFLGDLRPACEREPTHDASIEERNRVWSGSKPPLGPLRLPCCGHPEDLLFRPFAFYRRLNLCTAGAARGRYKQSGVLRERRN
jgi:hypothetical protein